MPLSACSSGNMIAVIKSDLIIDCSVFNKRRDVARVHRVQVHISHIHAHCSMLLSRACTGTHRSHASCRQMSRACTPTHHRSYVRSLLLSQACSLSLTTTLSPRIMYDDITAVSTRQDNATSAPLYMRHTVMQVLMAALDFLAAAAISTIWLHHWWSVNLEAA